MVQELVGPVHLLLEDIMNNSSYTTLKSDFTLQSSVKLDETVEEVEEMLGSNSTGYRYFRLRRTGGVGLYGFIILVLNGQRGSTGSGVNE